MTERAIFSQHLRGCRKHIKIHRPGRNVRNEGIIMDENIKEGEDFLKEVTEEEKEVMIFKKTPEDRQCPCQLWEFC